MALRMRNVPAVFEWSDVSSTPRAPLYLAGLEPLSVQLSLYFDEEQQTVSLKIRVLLHLGGEALDEASGEFLYGLIHPSNVALLCHDPAHHLPASVSPVLRGPTTTCLRLVLHNPVPIVVPSDIALPLRVASNSQQLFSSLGSLAKQTVLAIHVDQHNILSATALQRLCEAFTKGSVKQHPGYNALRGFYSGRGAAVLDGLAFASGNANKRVWDDGSDNDASASMPPPYAGDEKAPPPQLFAQARRKRKRAHADTQTPTLDDTQHKLQMEALLALLGGIEDRITKRIHTSLSEEVNKIRREKAQEWEHVIKPHIEEAVEDSVERNLAHGKEEFKDEVKDEVKQELKDDLENGLVSIILPR